MANGAIEVEARASLQNLSIEGEIDGNKLGYGPTKLYDYEKLINKPQIEGVTLIGNIQLSEFGLKELSNQIIEDILSKVFEED